MQILFFPQQNRSKFGPDVICHNRRPRAFYFAGGFTCYYRHYDRCNYCSSEFEKERETDFKSTKTSNAIRR
jgi:hypothetical protein